jgi:hypothetical protein
MVDDMLDEILAFSKDCYLNPLYFDLLQLIFADFQGRDERMRKNSLKDKLEEYEILHASLDCNLLLEIFGL